MFYWITLHWKSFHSFVLCQKRQESKEIFQKCNEIPKAVFKLDLQNESHHQASVLESHLQLPEKLFFGWPENEIKITLRHLITVWDTHWHCFIHLHKYYMYSSNICAYANKLKQIFIVIWNLSEVFTSLDGNASTEKISELWNLLRTWKSKDSGWTVLACSERQYLCNETGASQFNKVLG